VMIFFKRKVNRKKWRRKF